MLDVAWRGREAFGVCPHPFGAVCAGRRGFWLHCAGSAVVEGVGDVLAFGVGHCGASAAVAWSAEDAEILRGVDEGGVLGDRDDVVGGQVIVGAAPFAERGGPA